MRNNNVNNGRVDPDPISIGLIIIAGMSGLMQIEAKISARREIDRRRRSDRARSTISVALDDIQQSISVFESFWDFFTRVGQNESSPNLLGFGTAQKFVTEEEYTAILNRLDGVLDSIGTLNRAVQQILFTPLDDVDPDAGARATARCQALRKACNESLFSGRNNAEAFLTGLPELLRQARIFTRELRVALRVNGDEE